MLLLRIDPSQSRLDQDLEKTKKTQTNNLATSPEIRLVVETFVWLFVIFFTSIQIE